MFFEPPSIFLLSASSIAIFFGIIILMVIEGEAALLVFAALANLGVLHLSGFYILVAAFIGAYLSDLFWYFVGLRWGQILIDRFGKYFLITSIRFEKIKNHLANDGTWIIFVSKFLYGFNHFTLIAAGTAKYNFKRFTKLQLIASTIWVSIFFSLGYFFTGSISAIKHDIKLVTVFIVGIILLVVIIERIIGKLFIRKL